MIFSDWQSQIFEKKKFDGPSMGSFGLNQAQNEVFRHLLEFRSYFFLEIAYNYSFQWCQRLLRVKTHENNFLGPKSGPKLGF